MSPEGRKSKILLALLRDAKRLNNLPLVIGSIAAMETESQPGTHQSNTFTSTLSSFWHKKCPDAFPIGMCLLEQCRKLSGAMGGRGGW